MKSNIPHLSILLISIQKYFAMIVSYGSSHSGVFLAWNLLENARVLRIFLCIKFKYLVKVFLKVRIEKYIIGKSNSFHSCGKSNSTAVKMLVFFLNRHSESLFLLNFCRLKIFSFIPLTFLHKDCLLNSVYSVYFSVTLIPSFLYLASYNFDFSLHDIISLDWLESYQNVSLIIAV